MYGQLRSLVSCAPKKLVGVGKKHQTYYPMACGCHGCPRNRSELKSMEELVAIKKTKKAWLARAPRSRGCRSPRNCPADRRRRAATPAPLCPTHPRRPGAASGAFGPRTRRPETRRTSGARTGNGNRKNTPWLLFGTYPFHRYPRMNLCLILIGATDCRGKPDHSRREHPIVSLPGWSIRGEQYKRNRPGLWDSFSLIELNSQNLALKESTQNQV